MHDTLSIKLFVSINVIEVPLFLCPIHLSNYLFLLFLVEIEQTSGIIFISNLMSSL
jgi:hypothetical protein